MGAAPAQGPRATGRRARARLAQEQVARRRRLGIILGAATAIVVLVIAIVALKLNQPASALVDPNAISNSNNELSIGSKAPNFTASTVDGKQYTLAAQRGHVVLVELFAVWCPHCQRETAVLNQLDKTYGPKGLRDFSVLANQFGKNYETSNGTDTSFVTKSDIQWFKSTFNVQHPILVNRDFSTLNKYGLVKDATGQAGYPSIYIIDGNGIVRYRSTGEVTYQVLSNAVQAAMKGQSTK